MYHSGVRPTYWLPPVLWMALITLLSSDMGSAAHTEHWLLPILRALAPWATSAQLEVLHFLARKGAHLSEYAVLAALWFRALARGCGLSPRAAAWIAFTISLGWAGLDEAHQSLVPARTASRADVAIDGAGALVALGVARLGWRGAADRATTLLLWAGLVGGGVFLVVNALAGVPSGVLWLTVPGAALLLLARHLFARRRLGRS